MYGCYVYFNKDQSINQAKLLGIIFQSTSSFVDHVDYILKICSQRIFLLKKL